MKSSSSTASSKPSSKKERSKSSEGKGPVQEITRGPPSLLHPFGSKEEGALHQLTSSGPSPTYVKLIGPDHPPTKVMAAVEHHVSPTSSVSHSVVDSQEPPLKVVQSVDSSLGGTMNMDPPKEESTHSDPTPSSGKGGVPEQFHLKRGIQESSLDMQSLDEQSTAPGSSYRGPPRAIEATPNVKRPKQLDSWDGVSPNPAIRGQMQDVLPPPVLIRPPQVCPLPEQADMRDILQLNPPLGSIPPPGACRRPWIENVMRHAPAARFIEISTEDFEFIRNCISYEWLDARNKRALYYMFYETTIFRQDMNAALLASLFQYMIHMELMSERTTGPTLYERWGVGYKEIFSVVAYISVPYSMYKDQAPTVQSSTVHHTANIDVSEMGSVHDNLKHNVNVHEFFKLEEKHVTDILTSEKFKKWLTLLPHAHQQPSLLMDEFCLSYLPSYIKLQGAADEKPDINRISNKQLASLLTIAVDKQRRQEHRDVATLPAELKLIKLETVKKPEQIMKYLASMRAQCSRFASELAESVGYSKQVIKIIYDNLCPSQGKFNEFLHSHVNPDNLNNVLQYLDRIETTFNEHWQRMLPYENLIQWDTQGSTTPALKKVTPQKTSTTPAASGSSSRTAKTKAPKVAPTKCNGCGHPVHGWLDGGIPLNQYQCPMRLHDNWNGKAIPFEQTRAATDFAKYGYFALPETHIIDSNGNLVAKAMEHPKPKKGSKTSSSSSSTL